MADPGTVEGRKAQMDVVKKAEANPKLKTALLVEEFAARTDDPSFRTRTVTTKSLERQLQRAKAKALHKPKAPKSFDDLEDIPDEFKVNSSQFLRDFYAIFTRFSRDFYAIFT
jgi:FtsZ-interacting cell division protein YlmF